MKKIFRAAALALGVLAGAAVLAAAGYVGYLQLQYYRIEDGLALEVSDPPAGVLRQDTDYTAVSYNLGFGAYGPEYSFFMDTGVMDDGTPTRGLYGTARSKAEALAHTRGALDAAAALEPDFVLLQEVDHDSRRSHFVDQRQLAREAFAGYGSIWGENFHSGFLAYPFNDPHGAVNAGLLTLTRWSAAGGVRRSYPVDESFFIKFTDLDRCFTVLYLPVEGTDRQLALIHSHLSAYDEGGTVRARQWEMLCGVLEEEYEKGNYVVVGGDFNHALCGTAEAFACRQQLPAWVQTLDDGDLPEHFAFVQADNALETPTCRGADIPYEAGVNYVTVVDGFIVSDNVAASARNIHLDFAFSDHDPVELTFRLAG